MVPRVGIGGVGRDDVADPAEQATRTNPQARRNDEPQDTSQEATIIELSNSRDDSAQNRRYSRLAHCCLLFLSLARPCPTTKNVSRSRHTRHRSTDLFWPGQLYIAAFERRKKGRWRAPPLFLLRGVRRSYLTSLRAKSPPATKRTPVPSANSEAALLPPVFGSSFGAGAGAGAGAWAGAEAAFGGVALSL
jgi:hypothetical protein